MLNHKSIKFFKMAINAGNYKETPLDISCKCPICGDSKKKSNSKRLHLYTKVNSDTDFVSCFNAGCPCENKTVYSFLRDFFPSLLPQYKKETFGSKMESLKHISNTQSSSAVSNTFDFTEMKDSNVIRKQDFETGCIAKLETASIILKPLTFNLLPFFTTIDNEMLEYLNNRKIKPYFNNLAWFKAKTDIKIRETTYRIKDFLVVPLYLDGLMYGFYSRSIKEKTFITFISTNGFKVWNWFSINKQIPVYIFEAIFDGMSTGKTNIIANLGAKLPQERLDELQEAIFCLDNDNTGIKTSIEYAQKGHKVFVMPNKHKEKDFNELKINNPNLNISELIDNNIFSGMSAITRLKLKL